MAGLVMASVFFLPEADAKDRVWTSSTGSQIEASYVARVGGEHWLLEKSGRIIKLTADKFSPADAKLLETTPVGADDWLSTGRVIAVTTNDPAVLEALELLLATKIPAFTTTQVGLEDALAQLSAAIEQQDPRRRRVAFRLDPKFASRPVSVSTRNLTAVRVLNFIFNGQSSPVFATFTAGGVTFSAAPTGSSAD